MGVIKGIVLIKGTPVITSAVGDVIAFGNENQREGVKLGWRARSQQSAVPGAVWDSRSYRRMIIITGAFLAPPFCWRPDTLPLKYLKGDAPYCTASGSK